MAQEIQTPVPGSLLTDAFGLRGRVRPFLEEFIIPVISLGDLSLSIAPGVVRHATALINEAAAVGERWVGRFEAPAGVIAVIRQISLRSAGGLTTVSMRFPGSSPSITPANTCTKGFVDGRLLTGSGTSQTPACTLLSGTQVAALANPSFQTSLPAEGLVYLPPGGWVVGGGANAPGYMEMNVVGNNQACLGGIEWDEYQVLL